MCLVAAWCATRLCQRVLDEFRQWALGEGWQVVDSADCAVTGDRGNREIVVHVRTPARPEAPC